MIYIASPYTGTEQEMAARYEAVCRYVATLANVGAIPYSPIAHFHPIAVVHDLPREIDFWHKVNANMLRRAECLHVLMLYEWEKSAGVAYEIDLAKQIHLLIEYIEP